MVLNYVSWGRPVPRLGLLFSLIDNRRRVAPIIIAHAPKIAGTKIAHSLLKFKKFSSIMNGVAKPIASPPLYARLDAVARNCLRNLLDNIEGINAQPESATIIKPTNM